MSKYMKGIGRVAAVGTAVKVTVIKRALTVATIAAAAVLGSMQAQAVPVALELALMADVSGSVDTADFNLQRLGYQHAFEDAAVQAAIAASPNGIAVSLIYWSDAVVQTIGWTHLTDAVSANAFAAAIAAAGRPFSGGTGMTNAMTFTSGLFTNNGFEGRREVIDVSGDGSESNLCSSFVGTCVPLQNARNAFLAGGSARAINALWIDDRDFFGDDPADAINAFQYGITNVIGGAGAFQAIAQDFNTFEGEIISKIGREIIHETPEPSVLSLLGLGLLGLAWTRRRMV